MKLHTILYWNIQQNKHVNLLIYVYLHFTKKKEKQDQNWIDPKLAGLEITGILQKIETNKIIKS